MDPDIDIKLPMRLIDCTEPLNLFRNFIAPSTGTLPQQARIELFPDAGAE